MTTRSEAIAWIRGADTDLSTQLDIVFCEMELPDGHGIDVLKAVQASQSLHSVRVVMLTRAALPKETTSNSYTGDEHVISKAKIAADPSRWAQSVVQRFGGKVLAA